MTEPTRDGVASIHDVRPAYASALISRWTGSVVGARRGTSPTTWPACQSVRASTARPTRCQRACGRAASDR